MPELIEAELYRALAEGVVGRKVESIVAPDAWYLKDGLDAGELAAALTGEVFTAVRRHGKHVLLDGAHAGTLALHFGMSGRLLVDGRAAIEHLEYSSRQNRPEWDRFAVQFCDGGAMVMRDPRRLGAVRLDPDESRWGVDAWNISAQRLADALAPSSRALKARLLDQSVVAGLGNLLVDEALWRAGIAPGRAAASLDVSEVDALSTTVRSTVAELAERGGSHTGDLHEERHSGGRCPLDGAELVRATIGGRTTWFCPLHQR